MARNNGNLLDPATMRLSFGDDTEFIRATMRIYMRDAPALAQKALEALKAGDNRELAAASHALKGITGYFNKTEFYQSCLDLEMLGKNEGLPLQAVHALGLWAAVNKQLQDMLTFMRDFMEDAALP